MESSKPIEITVAYATPDCQRVIALTVPVGTTVRQAAVLAGALLSADFPDVSWTNCPLGIFGEVVCDTHPVKADDRVELYRRLLLEPQEARRQRARTAVLRNPRR